MTKDYGHDITEILLKVAINTKNPPSKWPCFFVPFYHIYNVLCDCRQTHLTPPSQPPPKKTQTKLNKTNKTKHKKKEPKKFKLKKLKTKAKTNKTKQEKQKIKKKKTQTKQQIDWHMCKLYIKNYLYFPGSYKECEWRYIWLDLWCVCFHTVFNFSSIWTFGR